MAQLINEAKRFQQLAGIITESQINEEQSPGLKIASLFNSNLFSNFTNLFKKKKNSLPQNINQEVSDAEKIKKELETKYGDAYLKIQQDPEIQKAFKEDWDKWVDFLDNSQGRAMFPGYAPNNLTDRVKDLILKKYPKEGQEIFDLINKYRFHNPQTSNTLEESIDIDSVVNEALETFRKENK